MQEAGAYYNVNFNFNKLSEEELIEYLNINGEIPSYRNLIRQAERLFNSGKNITYAIADMIIAETYDGPFDYYYERDIKKLTPENILYFRDLFQLNDQDENLLKERIYRILRMMGAIIPDNIDKKLELCKICPRINNFKNMCKYCSYLMGVDGNNLPEISEIYNIFIDNILNEIHLDDNVNIDKIVINTGESNGFGDIIFGRKLYYILTKYITSNVIIQTTSEMSEKYKQISSDIPVYTNSFPEEYREVDFLILAPGLPVFINSSALIEWKYQGINPKFIVRTDEYNYTTYETDKKYNEATMCRYRKNTGINLYSLGIFITENPENFNDIENPEFKQFYDNIILGKHIFISYCSEIDNMIIYIRRILEFHDKGFYKDGIRDIIFMTGYFYWKSRKLLKIKQDCISKGYNLIYYRKYTSEPIVEYYDEKNIKTCTLVQMRNINNNDVQVLMNKSDPYVSITGDQSLSEAISHNKKFSYEVLSHKEKLFNSMMYIAELLDLPKVIKVFNQTYNHENIEFDDIYNNDEFTTFNNFIKSYLDIRVNYIGMLKRFKLYLENPDNINTDEEFINSMIEDIEIDKIEINKYFNTIRSIFIRCFENNNDELLWTMKP